VLFKWMKLYRKEDFKEIDTDFAAVSLLRNG
jgi:hypothetical protein